MPVNDSTDVEEATTNCALCSVGGILGLTAGQVKAELEQSCGKITEPALAFVRYYEKKALLAPNDAATLDRQISGMIHYLGQKNLKVSVNGSGLTALTQAAATTLMTSVPGVNTFVYLIGDVFQGSRIGQAHWLVARKAIGVITWTDYQLDATGDAQFMYGMVRTGKNRSAQFGQPGVTTTPMRPFGLPAAVTDRAIVLCVGAAVWQPSTLPSGGRREVIGLHRATPATT